MSILEDPVVNILAKSKVLVIWSIEIIFSGVGEVSFNSSLHIPTSYQEPDLYPASGRIPISL